MLVMVFIFSESVAVSWGKVLFAKFINRDTTDTIE